MNDWPADSVYLSTLAARRAAIEAEIRAAVAQARADRMPWSLIGHALGTSKQAAQQRYGLENHGS